MAEHHQKVIERLANGETVTDYTEAGNSMLPYIKSKDKMVLVPIDHKDIKPNMAVFCKVNGYFYTHKVLAVRTGKNGVLEFKIGNNKGGENGWTSQVYGRCIDPWPH